MHLWYSKDSCEVAYEASYIINLKDSFLNLNINVFMHLTRSAFFRLNWYHIYVASRRHFESNCTMFASWYWSHEIWFTNMFTSWYRRSFEKLYCSEESKKPISFDVKTFFSFWISFDVGIFFFLDVLLITFIAIWFDDLRLYNNNKYND